MPWCTCSRRVRPGATCLTASVHGRASTTASQTGVQGRPLEADLPGAAAEGGDRRGNLADATIVRAHQDSAGAKGGLQSIAWVVHVVDSQRRSMPFRDAQGRPIHVELTAGQTHEATVAASLLEHADGRAFIGDTGYDAERIRAAAAARGMRVVIPSHPTRATEHRARQEALSDPLPHRVSVSPPRALSSPRDPLRKDRVATTLRSSIWGLAR